MEVLRTEKISKIIKDTIILNDISISVCKGQVLAIVGNNGSGKSTLINIISGITQRTSGSIFLHDKPIKAVSPKQAVKLGICTIFQRDGLFNNLTVAENIFINRRLYNESFPFRTINWKSIFKKAQAILDSIGLSHISSKTIVYNLTEQEKKLVEIARALVGGFDIVILDEPASILNAYEVDILNSVITRLKEQGVAIIYATNRIDCIESFADTVVILREGEIVTELKGDDLTSTNILKYLTDTKSANQYPKLNVTIKDKLLIVNDISTEYLHNISFILHKSEILGFTSTTDMDLIALSNALFGIDKTTGGSIYLNCRRLQNKSSDEFTKAGISYIPSNQRLHGLITSFNVADNIIAANMRAATKMGIISKNRKNNIASNYKSMLNINYTSSDDNISALSNGNQKKIVFSKWLFKNSSLVMLNEPTSEIDINSRIDLYNIINELILSNVGVIITSSNIAELAGMCDRIFIMRNGSICQELGSSSISPRAVRQALYNQRAN